MSTDVVPGAGYAALAARRAATSTPSRSTQAAVLLRSSILEGAFRPGERLSEPHLCDALGVSRNTLREAFRSLVEERLADAVLNRGTFVRRPDADDVRDIYAARRVLEVAGVAVPRSADVLAPVELALQRARDAAARTDWAAVGAADVAFHRAVVGMNGSQRLEAVMTTVWNELRLVFHLMQAPAAFHLPYLERNAEIVEACRRRDPRGAQQLVLAYLADAEAEILHHLAAV